MRSASNPRKTPATNVAAPREGRALPPRGTPSGQSLQRSRLLRLQICVSRPPAPGVDSINSGLSGIEGHPVRPPGSGGRFETPGDQRRSGRATSRAVRQEGSGCLQTRESIPSARSATLKAREAPRVNQRSRGSRIAPGLSNPVDVPTSSYEYLPFIYLFLLYRFVQKRISRLTH